MKTLTTTIVAALLALSASTGMAQEAGHGMATTESILPDACISDAGKAAAAKMIPMGADHSMDEAHAALMAGMDIMNADMMTGNMAADIDVAFVCGMIPHHQGAITMAKAELQYGDNAWAKELAQKVIDAQEQEIADMLAWLAEQPK